MDITCCPKYYFMALLGALLRDGLVYCIDLAYSEGEYASTEGTALTFTSGKWDPLVVPGFEGTYSPGNRRFFLLSVGFEGQRVLRLVSRYEPDRISLLMPDPGFNDTYTEEARSANETLVLEYRVPDCQIVKAYAGDAIEAWAKIDTTNGIHRPATEDAMYFCLGPKPHALALTLAALTLNWPSLVYCRPTSYVRRDVRSTGSFWVYRVSDISA